eukprot:gene14963-2541_t
MATSWLATTAYAATSGYLTQPRSVDSGGDSGEGSIIYPSCCMAWNAAPKKLSFE